MKTIQHPSRGSMGQHRILLAALQEQPALPFPTLGARSPRRRATAKMSCRVQTEKIRNSQFLLFLLLLLLLVLVLLFHLALVLLFHLANQQGSSSKH